MKATETIKQYNLKYDTTSGHYKHGGNIIDELIEVNETTCLFIKGSANFGAKNVFVIENDLPVIEHWKSDPEKGFICSRCGEGACYSPHGEKAFITLTPFCPFCGAEMDTNNNESENE